MKGIVFMPDQNKLKDFMSFALRIIISGLLLWYIFSKIDFSKVVGLIKTADVRFLIFALIANTVIVINMLYRWFIYIRALDLKVKSWDVIRFYLAGLFGNLFLPSAMGGDIIKIVGLCHNNDQKPKVVASVLLDRLSGFAAIAIVAILAL